MRVGVAEVHISGNRCISGVTFSGVDKEEIPCYEHRGFDSKLIRRGPVVSVLNDIGTRLLLLDTIAAAHDSTL